MQCDVCGADEVPWTFTMQTCIEDQPLQTERADLDDVTGDEKYTENVCPLLICKNGTSLVHITVMVQGLQAVICYSNSYLYTYVIDTNVCETFPIALKYIPTILNSLL